MRYSEILGEVYHKIRLTEEVAFWADVHFSAAGHHLIRFRQTPKESSEEKFHSELFERHLTRLKEIVYTAGDFRRAIDPTGEQLHKRSSWSPLRIGIPDCRMFAKAELLTDPRFGIGVTHISDQYLP